MEPLVEVRMVNGMKIKTSRDEFLPASSFMHAWLMMYYYLLICATWQLLLLSLTL